MSLRVGKASARLLVLANNSPAEGSPRRVRRDQLPAAKPGKVEVRIEKQPYQLCIERPEHLPTIGRTRGPMLVHNTGKIGVMSGLVGAMVAHRVAHGSHDSRITRDSA